MGAGPAPAIEPPFTPFFSHRDHGVIWLADSARPEPYGLWPFHLIIRQIKRHRRQSFLRVAVKGGARDRIGRRDRQPSDGRQPEDEPDEGQAQKFAQDLPPGGSGLGFHLGSLRIDLPVSGLSILF
jgi:hypothetical protein